MAINFNFTRKRDEDYDSINGEEKYYTFGDETNDIAVDDGGYESLHTQPAEAESAPFAPQPASVALKIVNPKGYEEAPAIADFLLNGNTVLLNVEGLDGANAVRLLDYLSGAVRMVGGMMTKVGKTTIVVAPKSVDVSSIEAMVGTN